MDSNNCRLSLEECKANAARCAVEENIHSDCILGIGSGSTMRYVLESLVKRCEEEKLVVKCIPTSYQSKQLIYDYKLPITELQINPEIDLTIDGADEVDSNLVCIKGGGACHLREKIVASASKKFIVVADYRKKSEHLGGQWAGGIPIEVVPEACEVVRLKLSRILDTSLDDITVRVGTGKVGPVITDNGNFVLDWKIKSITMSWEPNQWRTASEKIKLVPGVVETGLFVDMIHAAYFGHSDKSVSKRVRRVAE